MRGAGFVVAAQGAIGLIVAAVLVLRGLVGADQRVVGGVSLAVCFVLVGGAVLAAGWALVRGRRWGRGVAVFANLLLLPVTWYVAVDSHRWAYGAPIGVVALIVLGLLFSPAALGWVTGPQRDAASSTRSGPDTR